MKIDKEKMARLITEERRVLTGSLRTVPDIHQPFNLHKYDWMARDPGTYSEKIVREFYASYATTLCGSISKQSKPIAQDPLTSTMVRDGTSCGAALSRGMLSSERLLYYGWLALVTGLEIDFALIMLADIHERAFKTSTTYPFPCLIFQLCRDSGVSIWHCDRLIHLTGTLDIGLIRDEANVASPRREPHVEVPLLGADLVDTVGQAQGIDPIIPDHTDTILAFSSQGASRAPSSSRSKPPLGVVVPLARVHKLEAYMATLLHHIQPWMQKSIAKSEARME
ncbi:hypothetical protein H5410_030566 [Solanum commersonii]|uniref:Integrase core domain containing protein n=1 Tax=Solanum commersonii TaxID=4109 RepID=A0A9J5YJ25_SOLCO|nr:hypothetical protein H5410_030566 [Solanum commersonii]